MLDELNETFDTNQQQRPAVADHPQCQMVSSISVVGCDTARLSRAANRLSGGSSELAVGVPVLVADGIINELPQ